MAEPTGTTRESLRRERLQRIEARAQQMQEREQIRRKRRLLRLAIPIGIIVLLVAAVLAYAVLEASRPLPGEPVADEGRSHVEVGAQIPYATYPPASGPHYPTPAQWQFNNQPLEPGFWVHNLEHGGVVILYNCGDAGAGCEELKSQLRNLYNVLPASARYRYVKLVVAPDAKIPSTLALLAWDHREMLNTYDEGEIKRFYQAFVDRGPEDAP